MTERKGLQASGNRRGGSQTLWPQPFEASGAAVAGDGSGSLSRAGGGGGEDD